ncbi:MAG: HAMP domain-containing histidine kinase [Acetobacteraceae bacterium]|nr:HAMP domain-containing histidine kinase [Acetobacteraceae bacterium]
MYRTLLVACFAGLLALAVLAGGVAWWGAEQSRWQLERTRLANEVVQHYLRLRADIYAVFTRMADAVEHPTRVTEVREAEERRRILEALDRVRQGIGREVAFLGPGSDEPEELTRLGEIERGLLYVFGQFRQAKALIAMGRSAEAEQVLDRALSDSVGNGFRSLVDEGVREEEQEAAEAQARAERALALVAILSKVSAGLVLLLGVGGLALLIRRLQAPLRELEAAAQAVRAGDFSRRADVGRGADEFARVAESFNAMVQEVAAGRAAQEQAKRGLEDAVAARTAELADANAALQQSDLARRRFLADISHELRTPLTVIRGEAEVTLRGGERDVAEYRAALARVAEQAAHTARLVDDLLFLARAEAGAPRLRLGAISLDGLVRKVVDETGAAARAAGLRLVVSGVPTDAVIEGDAGRMQQVMMILIDNAIRYSRRGGKVEVALLPGPAAVVLRVADDGIGIDAEDLPHVFDRFFRGDRAQQHTGEGSGLGLPLARSIVEAHRGRIAIESRPGTGTTVSVTLPLASRIRSVLQGPGTAGTPPRAGSAGDGDAREA